MFSTNATSSELGTLDIGSNEASKAIPKEGTLWGCMVEWYEFGEESEFEVPQIVSTPCPQHVGPLHASS